MLHLGLLMLVAGPPAAAQDRSTQERLERLERDLNMLQRQVYRGAPAPMGGDPGAAVGMELRLNRMEDQMRELTGRVEEYTNQIERLHARLEQMNSDVTARFGEGAPAGGPMVAAGPPPGRSPPLGAGPGPRRLPENDDFPPPPPPGRSGGAGPAPIFGTLTPPGAPPPPGSPVAPPSELASSAGEGLGPARSMPSGSATEQYNHAFGLLKQADYPAAETALRAFVEQHPNDQMAGNAQYWLGDTYFARGRYPDAARAFAEVYKRYPKSVKAPEALLKLGMSLGQSNQKQNACVALAQLDQAFPHAASNVKQQAAAEKKRLSCS